MIYFFSGSQNKKLRLDESLHEEHPSHQLVKSLNQIILNMSWEFKLNVEDDFTEESIIQSVSRFRSMASDIGDKCFVNFSPFEKLCYCFSKDRNFRENVSKLFGETFKNAVEEQFNTI